MMSEKLDSPAPPIGVIESLATGLETVATHLPLLLLPLLLDLCLWLGPRISYRPLLEDFYHKTWEPALEFWGQRSNEDWAAASADAAQIVQSTPDRYLYVFTIPSMTAGRQAKPLPFGYSPPTWQIQTPAQAIGLNVLLLAAGSVLLIVYMGLMAQQVKDNRVRLGQLARQVPLVLVQFFVLQALLFVLVLLILFLLTLVFLAIAMLGSLLASGDQIASVLSLVTFSLVFFVVTWIGLFLAFTIHDMLMNDRWLFAAMWDSLRVVQWNMSATFGLFLIILIVLTAMGYVWGWLDYGSGLVPLGIMVNAFISTGLLTATFVFFKDRYRYWRELREVLLAELERRRIQQSNVDK